MCDYNVRLKTYRMAALRNIADIKSVKPICGKTADFAAVGLRPKYNYPNANIATRWSVRGLLKNSAYRGVALVVHYRLLFLSAHPSL